ncbi:homologous recombination OB-fold protein [Anguilla rostrata]|uniref:homologous recombination OB-fold protein n=1 Tax=Anguilla rostrata TaxID=7938 RepID=UPI0030D46AC9
MTTMACKWNGIFNVGEDFDDEDLLKADWDVATDPVFTAPVTVTGASCRLRDLTATSVPATEAGHGDSHNLQGNGPYPASTADKTVYRIKYLSNSTAPPVPSCPPPPPACPKFQRGTAGVGRPPSSAPAPIDRLPDPFPDDFDDWDVDLEDLDEAFQQQGAGPTVAPPPSAQSSSDCVSPAKRMCLSERGGGAQPCVRLRDPAHASRPPPQPVGATEPRPPFAVPGGASPRPVLRPPAPPPSSGGAAAPSSSSHPGHVTPRPLRPPPRRQTPGPAGRVPGCPSYGTASPSPPAVAPSPLRAPVFTNHLAQLVSAANKTPQELRPCQAPPKTRRFPGPAGLLPQQLHGRSLDDIVVSVPQTPTHGAVARLPSQMPSSQASEDEDFAGGPWAAMRAEMGLDERNPACFLHSYSVAMVLRKAALKQLAKNKVPNMAVMVKSLTHTHADARAVFRDPTGEIRGTVHRRLLEDRQGELKTGAVLLLKQVGVFSPSHRNHYLNVTPNNLLRIYSPDRTTWSSTQLSHHSQEGPIPQLEQTSWPPGGAISNMELQFEDEDECSEGLPESAGPEGVKDLAWETDDLDRLLGELPEDSYTL